MIVAGIVPWLLTRWDADPQPFVLRILGVALLLVGGALVVETTARFALVIRSSTTLITILYAWAVVAWVIFELSLVTWEEPQLRRRFGESYDDYRRRVRRWLPTRPRSPRY